MTRPKSVKESNHSKFELDRRLSAQARARPNSNDFTKKMVKSFVHNFLKQHRPDLVPFQAKNLSYVIGEKRIHVNWGKVSCELGML